MKPGRAKVSGHQPPRAEQAAVPIPIEAPSRLLAELVDALNGDPFWEPYLESLRQPASPHALHLAVFAEPFLSHLLAGRKTMESRFSKRRIAPYERISPGDVMLIKRSGGPIVGIARIGDASFHQLDQAMLDSIRAEHSEALSATDPAFWKAQRNANFASLMPIDHVQTLAPVAIDKHDRRGWVIVTPHRDNSVLSSAF